MLQLGATARGTAPGVILPLYRQEEVSGSRKLIIYSGEYKLSTDGGDKMLRIRNTAMLASVTIGYKVKLLLDKNKALPAERRRALLQEQYDEKCKQISLLDESILEASRIRDKIAGLKKRLVRAFPEEQFNISEEKIRGSISRDDLHRLEKLARNIARNNQRIKIPETVVFNGAKYIVEEENRITYCADGLAIRASDDFRLFLQPPGDGPFRLSWKFEVDTRTSRSNDVGFSIVEQMPDGTLPQIVPYRRGRINLEPSFITLAPRDKDSTMIVLFDNTYSWLKGKIIECVHSSYTERTYSISSLY